MAEQFLSNSFAGREKLAASTAKWGKSHFPLPGNLPITIWNAAG
jgi:hypothetical protein